MVREAAAGPDVVVRGCGLVQERDRRISPKWVPEGGCGVGDTPHLWVPHRWLGTLTNDNSISDHGLAAKKFAVLDVECELAVTGSRALFVGADSCRCFRAVTGGSVDRPEHVQGVVAMP